MQSEPPATHQKTRCQLPGGLILSQLSIPRVSRVADQALRAVFLAGLVLSGCGDGIVARNSPADSAITARYVELFRAEYTAKDAMQAYYESYCELWRIKQLLTEQHGNSYALGVIRGAQQRALRDIPESMRREHAARLPNTLPALSRDHCARIARTGVLGDTTFPPGK